MVGINRDMTLGIFRDSVKKAALLGAAFLRIAGARCRANYRRVFMGVQ